MRVRFGGFTLDSDQRHLLKESPVISRRFQSRNRELRRNVLGGELIAAYPLSYAKTLAPSLPPTRESLIEEAKMNLSNERLARPPFEDIRFQIVPQ